MDTAAYGEWNPVFVKVEGSYAAGGTVLNTFKDPSGKLFDVTNKVEALEPNRLLRQKGGFTGMLTFDHQWFWSRLKRHKGYSIRNRSRPLRMVLG